MGLTISIRMDPRVKKLFSSPRKTLMEMSGIYNAMADSKNIIGSMIEDNFNSGKNEDGSSWKSWTPETKNIVNNLGNVKLKPVVDNVYQEYLKGSGKYFKTLTELSYAKGYFGTPVSLSSILNSRSPKAAFRFSSNDASGVWSHFRRKETKGMRIANRTVKAREVVYWTNKGVEDTLNAMIQGFNQYWQ